MRGWAVYNLKSFNRVNIYYLKQYLLWVILSGLILGLFLREFFNLSNASALLLFLFALVFFIYSVFLSSGDFKTKFFLFAGFLLFLSLGILRYNQYLPREIPIFENQIGKSIQIEGQITNDPEGGPKSQKIIISPAKIGQSDVSEEAKIIIFAKSHPKYKYKDEIIVSGILERPDNFETLSGREFDYISYLKKDRILYQVSFPKVSLKNREESFLGWLYSFKHLFLASIEKNIPEPEGALLSGILLGEKTGLSSSLKEEFRKSGLIHIIVLSGYNISIVADAFGWLVSNLPKFWRIFGSSGAVVLFVSMVAAGPAAARAGAMAILLLLSKGLNRSYMASRALAFAVLLMLLYNPLSLMNDPGFQLSVLATAGLIYFSPFLEEKLKNWRKFKFLREVFIASVSAQLFVLPLLIYQSGEISLFALPANLLSLPSMPIVMFAGFTSSILGIFSPLFATPFSFISYFLLKYIFFISGFFASLSFSIIKIPEFSGIVLMLLYLPHVIFIFKSKKRPRANQEALLIQSSPKEAKASL